MYLDATSSKYEVEINNAEKMQEQKRLETLVVVQEFQANIGKENEVQADSGSSDRSRNEVTLNARN